VVGTAGARRWGSAPRTVCTGCGAIALATDGARIFFASQLTGGAIGSVAVSGGTVTTLAANAAPLQSGFGLSGGYLYYASGSNIMRAPASGGGASVYLSTSASQLAVRDNTLCWFGTAGVVCRNLLTGVNTTIAPPAGVRTALHLGGGFVYWGEGDGSIRRSPSSAPAVTLVKNPETGRTVREVVTDAQRAYFIDRPTTGDTTQRRLRRVLLTGGNGGTLYGQDASTQGAMGLQLLGQELYWGDNQGIEGAPSYPQEFALP
jgi:hypothetical protein